MKLNTESRNVERSGDFREKSFSIAANAHAFDILSSKLYTDTKLAIVRELSTNAADAHVAAGNTDKPFNVHMPNSMDPFFSIRDFGTGLSQEDLETVYTTYFQSTRNNSNDYTGALGLGSKSPFAYTDMFTVTSYYNGKAYTYSAFKNETGEPSIALMNEVATDEPNGLEIKIEVKRGDHYDFHDAGKKVYRFFNPQPVITGHRLEIPNPEPIIAGDGYQFFTKGGYSHTINVVMGNVCYEATAAARNTSLNNGTLVLYVDIGECQVAASREELHYDEVTKKNIQVRVDAAVKDAYLKIEASIKDCTTDLEKVIARKQFSNILTIASKNNKISLNVTDQYCLIHAAYYSNRLRIHDDLLWRDRCLTPGSNTKYHFIENDLPDGDITQKYKRRLRHWIVTNSLIDNILLCTIEDHKAFKKVFGAVNIKMSDLPDVPRKQHAGGATGPRSFVKRLDNPNASRMTNKWKTISDAKPCTTNAIAVPRQGFNIVWFGTERSPSAINNIAKLLGYDVVYGIAETHFDRICKELKLDSLEDLAEKYIKNFITTTDKFVRSRYHNSWCYSDFSSKLLKSIAGLSNVCDDLILMSQTKTPDHSIHALIDAFQLTMPAADNYQELFKKRYPLLANVDFDYADMKDITDYIKLIEGKK